jgi:7-cyano-7-deazaguanine synthase
MKPTLVCLSGGLDSAVVLASLLRVEGEVGSAVGFDYGQPHVIELDYAERLAAHYGVPFRRVRLPPMPLVNDVVFAARNMVLASHAVAIAAAEGFGAVAFGCNFSDWERFPDCRPAFWKRLGEAAREAYGVGLMTPLLHMTKAQVVHCAREIGVPIDQTWSCYAPTAEGAPCERCLACETRRSARA